MVRKVDDESKNGEWRLVWAQHYGWFQARYIKEAGYWVQPTGALTLEYQVSHYRTLPAAPGKLTSELR